MAEVEQAVDVVDEMFQDEEPEKEEKVVEKEESTPSPEPEPEPSPEPPDNGFFKSDGPDAQKDEEDQDKDKTQQETQQKPPDKEAKEDKPPEEEPGSKTPPENHLVALQKEREQNRLAMEQNRQLQKQLTEVMNRLPKPETKEEKKADDAAQAAIEKLTEVPADGDFFERGEEYFNNVVRTVNQLSEMLQNRQPAQETPPPVDVDTRIQEMLARKAHDDYDKVVKESGFNELLHTRLAEESQAGQEGPAHSVLKRIMESPDRGEAFYDAAKTWYDQNVAPVEVENSLNTLLTAGKITQEQYDAIKAAEAKDPKGTPKKPAKRGKEKTLADVPAGGKTVKPATEPDQVVDLFSENGGLR